MATLYFRISSDWEQVVKLRDEIKKLENQLKSFGKSTPEQEIHKTEERLAATRQEFTRLTTEAAKAGAAMENDFKRKIYDASQSVNGFTERIIAQRNVVKNVEADVRRLGEVYREAMKNRPWEAQGKLSEYNAAKKILDEERASLFGLTQQQAEARLSVKRLKDEYALYKKEAGETVEATDKMSISLGKVLGVIGGVSALKQLGSEIIRVRGEFQSMQTAIETMVGKDVASGLIAQLKEMAKISPLTLTDVVDAEKMMLGFNIQAEDTIRYLQALSDISMGDSAKFKSLTLAFSQMSAAGRLLGGDLNQMINAGFNPLQLIAERTGKSIAVLKDEMSKGAVSAEMVQQVFIDATSAGGKFYQMSENASKTINGQLSMMQDALDNAFNEMGQASESVIMEAIQTSTSLIQNYETVGKVLVGLVTTYGVYRTAVMLATAATSKHTIAEIALTSAKVLARKAQLLLNAAMLTNPYVAIATVIAGLVATMWALSDSTSAAEKAQQRFNEEQDKLSQRETERKNQVESLIRVIQDETETELAKINAYEQLQKLSPAITSAYKQEELATLDLANAQKLLNKERDTNTYDAYVRNIEESTQRLRKLREENGKVVGMSPSTGIPLTINNDKAIAEEEAYLRQQQKALDDFSKKLMAADAETVQTTYKEDYEKARKEWETAKKELLNIEADKDKFTTEQYEKAKKRVETAKKAYQNLGGTTSISKSNKQKQLVSPSITVPDEEVSLITPEEIQKNIDLHREMMDKFLADYGTYQQKREAIADMYALKIAQAETEGGRLFLQKQSEEALQKLDFETFKDSIDFADIFGNLDEQTTDALRVLRDKLASYINQAASELRPEDLKELQDAFSKLDFKIAERDPWEEMKSALQEYRDALREVNEAKEESVNKTESQAKAEGKLQAAEQKRMKALSKLTTATNSLGEQGVQVVNMGNQLVDMLSSFGVEVPEAVSGALDGLGQVMNGLANLDFSKPFSIITSAVSVFTGLGKTIGSLFGIGGADYSGYEEMRSQYEALLSVWDDLIAKKKEYINISYGAEAIKAAEEVQQMLDTELRTYRQLADQLLASGAGIGSHSLARRIEDRMTAEDWARVSGLVGKQLSGSAYDLFDLDPSVIGEALKDEKLVSVLNEVGPELVEYIQKIASYEEGVNEVTDALKESLTGVSFDEFQNSFVDMLSNLDATNEDFADNLEKYLQNAIFSSLVANQYKSRIQKLYNQWSDYAESGNSLTSDEADKIRQEYNQIVNDMLADRNQIMETMGWQAESSSQQQQLTGIQHHRLAGEHRRDERATDRHTDGGRRDEEPGDSADRGHHSDERLARRSRRILAEA